MLYIMYYAHMIQMSLHCGPECDHHKNNFPLKFVCLNFHLEATNIMGATLWER